MMLVVCGCLGVCLVIWYAVRCLICLWGVCGSFAVVVAVLWAGFA